MYRCQICRTPSEAGQDRLIHNIYREDKSILCEVAVCSTCQKELSKGTPYSDLVARHKEDQVAPDYKEGIPSVKVNGVSVKLPHKTLVETAGGKQQWIEVRNDSKPIKGKTKKQRKAQAEQLVVNKPLSIGTPVQLSGERIEAPE